MIRYWLVSIVKLRASLVKIWTVTRNEALKNEVHAKRGLEDLIRYDSVDGTRITESIVFVTGELGAVYFVIEIHDRNCSL